MAMRVARGSVTENIRRREEKRREDQLSSEGVSMEKE